MVLFLPVSPDEVMEEIGRILDHQRREKKPSSWVFSECISWEDQNRFQIVPVYGGFYHISTQARRLSEQEISAEEMKADLQKLFGKYWSPPRILLRLGVGAIKLLGIALLFTAVGLVHLGLSAWVGNVPAAAVIIGILLAVVLIPQGMNEIWKWHHRRDDEKSVVYQQTILQRLGWVVFSRCPKCGKYLGNPPVDDDGSVRCSCGFQIERK
jgi:hypothetical protein